MVSFIFATKKFFFLKFESEVVVIHPEKEVSKKKKKTHIHTVTFHKRCDKKNLSFLIRDDDRSGVAAPKVFPPFPNPKTLLYSTKTGVFCFLSPEATILEEKKASEEVFFLTLLLLLLLLSAGSRLIF